MRLLAVLLLILIGGCSVNRGDLQTVESVDLNRYLGKWYQYAYVPSSFQPLEGALSTAEYSLLPNGKISVVNTNYEDWAGTRIRKVAKAKAWVVDPSNAKLKVSFFWPFSGNYWIIDLDSENYSYAVVGEPGLKYVWFLSRSPLMDPERYEQLKARVADQGYDISKIVETHR
ncbi:MAG: lipocalin family protein [Candidatus Cloacimonadota bacterium]